MVSGDGGVRVHVSRQERQLVGEVLRVHGRACLYRLVKVLLYYFYYNELFKLLLIPPTAFI